MDFGTLTMSKKLKRKLLKANRTLTQNLLGEKAKFDLNRQGKKVYFFERGAGNSNSMGSYDYDDNGLITKYNYKYYDLTPNQAPDNWEASQVLNLGFRIKKGSKNFKKHVSDLNKLGTNETFREISDRGLVTQNGSELASFLDDQCRGILPNHGASTVVMYSDTSSYGSA